MPPFALATSISYKTDVFPLLSDIYGIYLMFLCYYIVWPCDFDLLTLTVLRILHMLHICQTRASILIILWLSVTELWIIEFDRIAVIRHSHCGCTVSRDLSSEGKNDPHFWNPWPQLTPQNEELSHPKGTAKSRILSRNSCYKILHAVCHPGRKHACQFWWRSV